MFIFVSFIFSVFESEWKQKEKNHKDEKNIRTWNTSGKLLPIAHLASTLRAAIQFLPDFSKRAYTLGLCLTCALSLYRSFF